MLKLESPILPILAALAALSCAAETVDAPEPAGAVEGLEAACSAPTALGFDCGLGCAPEAWVALPPEAPQCSAGTAARDPEHGFGVLLPASEGPRSYLVRVLPGSCVRLRVSPGLELLAEGAPLPGLCAVWTHPSPDTTPAPSSATDFGQLEVWIPAWREGAISVEGDEAAACDLSC